VSYDGPVIPHCIAVGLAKGGTGKSSTAANLAAAAARSGWRVLVVDLDPQNNIAVDFGVYPEASAQGGEAMLAAALVPDTKLRVLRDVRPGLDISPGGPGIETLSTILSLRVHGAVGDMETIEDLKRVKGRLARSLEAPEAEFDLIGHAIATVADDYDLIVIDTPPTDTTLALSALSAARFLLIPTRGDSASLLGFDRLAERYAVIKSTRNPALELLGVVLFDFALQERRLIADAREAVEGALDGASIVFSTVIRSSRKAAVDMRDAGIVAVEYGERAATATPWYTAKKTGEDVVRYSTAAAGLAEDYLALTREILLRMRELRDAEQPVAAADDLSVAIDLNAAPHVADNAGKEPSVDSSSPSVNPVFTEQPSWA
jgi:chromosome partitioning protein